MEYTSLTPEQFAALEGLDDWRFVLGAIHANFRAGSFGVAGKQKRDAPLRMRPQ